MAPISMTVNEVLEQHDALEVRLTTRLLAPDKAGEQSYVQIQGDATALRFLGRLLLAMADAHGPQRWQAAVDGAGAKYFDSNSSVGLYLDKTE